MHITASVTMDYDCIKAFSFMHNTGKRKISAMGIFFNVVLAVCLVYVGILTIMEPSILPDFIFLMLFGVFFNVLVILLNRFLLPKLQCKMMGQLVGRTNTYIFHDTYFESSTQSGGICESLSFEYCMLFKITETDRYLFLYQNKMSAFIIDKKTLEGNEGELLQETLKRIVPKYIRCSY